MTPGGMFVIAGVVLFILGGIYLWTRWGGQE